uniref:KIAA1614 n=1 Tax=Cyanoderma ruficeps TaxID=181631 RepID=A0A8C3XI19_9PASS
MEGSPPAEARRLPRPPKQHGQSGGRGPAPPERPEPARGPHAVLEGKVKALKEKRGGRPGTPAAAPERPSPKKPRSRRGKAGTEAEPRAQLRTYLTDGLLDGGEPGPGSPPAPRPGTPGLWMVPAPRGDVPGGPELPLDKGSRSRRSASLHERPSRDEEPRAPLRNRGRPSVSPPRADSWERLSLAERVERNRRLLQEVLGLGPPEMPASDGDWDSGVSLQDAEGCRAFVAGQELELSPRHEQAKQLLQRARMKARTNPLRASHDILLLPAAAPRPREPSGRPSVAPRDGGSLSDSSSGESSCGRPRRPRGPSPSRVRFEDESARDAEVRYLERLQLRHRRALGSALPSPEPAGSRQPGDGAGQPKARGGDLVAGGKCSACGSFLGAAAGRGTDTQAAPDAAKSSPAAQRSVLGDSRGPSAAQTEPKIRPLGPGGSPLWILPSRQRIHTEKIKETYIGDVTYIDEVDSALESTDTSDGCRTDSEEAGPRSPHLRGHRDPRTRGHRTPRAAPQAEARGRKGTSVASGGPEGGDSGPGPVCPPPPGRTSSREDGEPHRHLGGSKGVGNTARPPQQPGEPLEPSSQLRTSTPIPGTHVPAPPPTKKACAQVPCRKALFSSGSRQAPSQGVRDMEPDAASAAPPQPGGTAGPAERRGPCSPRWLPGSPFRALSTNNCNNTHGQDAPGTGRGTASHPAASPATPVAPEAAHPAGEGAGMPGAQPQRHPAGSAAHGEPGRPVSRKGSSASASGLKKLLCSLSQSTKQRLGRFRCYSMEQLPAPGGSPPGGRRVKKSPSLQSLQLVSPFSQPQKAASIQSLYSQLGKAPRASAYLLPQSTADRKGGSGPQRSLSVEDIGAPGQLRAVGRVVEVFPDGTSQLELQRPPHGAFGFSVTSGHGRPDTGVYVQEMADAGTAKLYAGLLGVGDEILQVNGAAVSGLGLPRIRELLLQADSLTLRVLRHRPAPR